jgi:transcriptional regulator with XRE-family HTH domain
VDARDPFFDELDELRVDFAAVLRRLRKEHFDSQADFAKRARLSPKTISKLERRGSDPPLSMLLILIEALPEVTALELIGGLHAPKGRKPPSHHK